MYNPEIAISVMIGIIGAYCLYEIVGNAVSYYFTKTLNIFGVFFFFDKDESEESEGDNNLTPQ